MTDQLVQQELLAQTVTAVPARVDLALANQRRSLLAGEVISELMEAAVTDEAVQAAYDATYANAEPARNGARPTSSSPPRTRPKAVEDRLAAGEDFAAVAKEVSTDTGSGAQGGELGWFGPGMMVPEFETGVAALRPGEVSAPIESQFGWHVIKLRRPATSRPRRSTRSAARSRARCATPPSRPASPSCRRRATRPSRAGPVRPDRARQPRRSSRTELAPPHAAGARPFPDLPAIGGVRLATAQAGVRTRAAPT